MPSQTNILWFRQDLRLTDNPALTAAAHNARLLPIYILDDTPHPWSPGAATNWWLHHSLASLATALAKLGTPLILRRGNPATILPALAEHLRAAAIHTSHAHEPTLRTTDAALAKALPSNRQLHHHRTSTLIDPDQIRSQTNTVYGMYTPFARAVEARGEPDQPLPAPTKLHPAAPTPSDRLEDWQLLPTHPDWAGGLRALWHPGEAAAQSRLKTFVASAVSAYAKGRNLPGEDGTSMLSPHLHFGELSPRTVWHASRTETDTPDHHTYRRELIWRDFSAYLLWHHPTLPDAPLRPAFARLTFRKSKPDLHAWQQGQTGVPIVDAGMRQLWQTGWMHNRVRMIAASFLVKHLLIDWREGEAWFWDTLVDADLASNAASWQWIAGTGIDAQPFFRVFNPVSQGEKFDQDGAYVRRFVPELARLPNKLLHAPWTASPAQLSEAGVRLGSTYPRPIVDLAAGRTRALETYRATVREPAA